LRFHHRLTRDAAYRRVLKGTRAELHGRVADWIGGKVGGAIEHDETIGWQLEQAHQHLRALGAIDAQGRVLGERAARYLGAAGRRALARDDLPVAADLLGRAIERLDAADPARADLALDWCEALLAAGDVGHARGAIDELGRFISRAPLETPPKEGGYSGRTGGVDTEESLRSSRPGPVLSGAVSRDRLRAWHTCFTGRLAALTDPQALHTTAAAVAAAADELAAAGDANAHLVHALALSRLGKIGTCEAALDKALAAARRADDRRRANTVLANAARVDAAIADRDADALRNLLTDDHQALHHATGLVYDREGALVSWRALLRAQNPGASALTATRGAASSTFGYDATVWFCDRFVDRRSRTHDQMIQAARSGKQNIVGGGRQEPPVPGAAGAGAVDPRLRGPLPVA